MMRFADRMIEKAFGGKGPKKFEQAIQKGEDPPYDLDPIDDPLIIVVMGATGAGKSTYINSLLGTPSMVVGHHLHGCTKHLKWEVVSISSTPLGQHQKFQNYGERKVVLVDTPGFDDQELTDIEILRRIAVWLAQSFDKGTKVAGLVFLHNMANARIGRMAANQIQLMQDITGRKALSRVIIGLTQWELLKLLPGQVLETRQDDLRKKYYAEALGRSATMLRVHTQDLEGSPEATSTARWDQLSQTLLFAIEKTSPILNIQDELVKCNRKIKDTRAHRAIVKALEEQKKMEEKKSQKSTGTSNAPPDQAVLDDPDTELERLRNMKEHAGLVVEMERMGARFSSSFKAFFGLA